MNKMVAKRVSRDDIFNYVTAILTKGFTKKAAYLEYIDPYSKSPSQALAQFERKKEFQDIYVSVVNSDAHLMAVQVKRVQNKYATVVEKTLDRTEELLDSAKDEKDIGKKSQVIRLATETVSGLAIINNTPVANQPAGLNKAGAVL